MANPTKIEELRAELQALMRKRYQEGISIRLSCEPTVADPEQTITVTARIIAPTSTLEAIQPVLQCKEATGFGQQSLKMHATGEGFRDYRVEFSASDFHPGRVYRLTLHLSSGTEAIAGCTLRILSKDVLMRAKRSIQAIALGAPAPSGKVRPSGHGRRKRTR